MKIIKLHLTIWTFYIKTRCVVLSTEFPFVKAKSIIHR